MSQLKIKWWLTQASMVVLCCVLEQDITGSTKEMSGYDWKIVDLNVKHQLKTNRHGQIWANIGQLCQLRKIIEFLCPQLWKSWKCIFLWACRSVLLFTCPFRIWDRILKFQRWIPHKKLLMFFFYFLKSWLSPFVELCPFERVIMKFCNQIISKARSFKLGQLIEDNDQITWWKLKKKSYFIFWGVITLCKFGHRKLDILKTITARSFKLGQLIGDNE